ncbi:hypothetical protein HNQ07_002726 [Deinococcus metalli]|uniref:DUF1440 domain-containing protein n=1 Tax=Deinococcus metalli TaxID=1141878 RepID=A0A7W8NRT8_9DEIO|nr:hypothetical protein [Deinococcus metalli]MBB5377253.1 hypothetical protein [Deinococcus metalli]GHF47855.1 hypothetical protein GCM10017781_25230 [Deinococcus metalli]
MPTLSSSIRRLLRPEPTPSPAYRDAVIGVLAGTAGTLLMGQWSTRVAPLIAGDQDTAVKPQPDKDVISPLGQEHVPGESSTAALGRHLYQLISHQMPQKGTRTALSEAVHWGTGVLGGAAYGALAARRQGPLTGALFGAGLWLVLDETITPLLGLQDGPRGMDARTHANRLGAHLAYGLGLGLAAAALNAALPD